MATEPPRPKGRDNTLPALNVAIDALNLTKKASSIDAPTKAVFGSVCVLLTTIRDSMSNEQAYVELGLNCADICEALDQGLDGKGLDDLNQSAREAVNRLTTTVAEIQGKVTKRSGRSRVSRLLRSSNDREKITAWKLELDRILQVFNTQLVINTHVTVSGIRDDVSKIREEGQVRPAQASAPGELPPPPPRACFGRDELIERITCLAQGFNPVALVGPGGIGKTSIALTVLHHDRVKERFGENRRFIRCDQFSASQINFLNRLSKAIGASVENPEDLTPLRPFLSSREMLVVLDNAESILDPQGVDGQRIYGVVRELCQLSNICIVITSRITTIPPDCKRLDVPTLSIDAARSAFHRICDKNTRPDLIDRILEQLDFHPLSVTLLATVAHQNNWDDDRLAKEWERRRTGVLQTKHNESLAATIELSLASPTFEKLGPDARELLAIVAFFPQGVDENNLDWLFPTIPNRSTIFDEFCTLSLTYRSDGFITMLVPLQDYLRPKDPLSSPLFCSTKERYFTRLSVNLRPSAPGFKETRWIASEDANIEHLLNVLTSIDTNSDEVWRACENFLGHLYWHKPRQTVLGPKIEDLPDDHHMKGGCLFTLSRLFASVGNSLERKRLLEHALRLKRDREDERFVASALAELSETNRGLRLYEEGIHQVKEALEIYERIGEIGKQGSCLVKLAWFLYADKQFDAAQEAASRAIELLTGKGEEFRICSSHSVLGEVYYSKGEREKAIHHFETSLGIASSFGWSEQLYRNHYGLAELFGIESNFEDAHSHIERAKSYVVDDAYHLGRAVLLQARIYYQQLELEDAMSEASRALEIFEKLGALWWADECRDLLREIEPEAGSEVGSPIPDISCGTFANTLDTNDVSG